MTLGEKMKYVIRLVAIYFVIEGAYLFTGFSMAVRDSDDVSIIYILIFGVVFAGISQLGLWLSTCGFGIRHKLITIILMLPFLFLLCDSVSEVVSRLIRSRNQMPIYVSGSYIIGLCIYLSAIYILVRSEEDEDSVPNKSLEQTA